jgi:hypothetical protein
VYGVVTPYSLEAGQGRYSPHTKGRIRVDSISNFLQHNATPLSSPITPSVPPMSSSQLLQSYHRRLNRQTTNERTPRTTTTTFNPKRFLIHHTISLHFSFPSKLVSTCLVFCENGEGRWEMGDGRSKAW